PSLDNGGLTQSPFTVRYKINTAAKWSDGTPITCADFDFTRNAILNTKGTYTTVGYAATPGGSGISSIDCTDPHTAVLKFSGPFDAIFPQPEVSQAKLFASNSAVKFVGTPGQYFESLWFNVSKAPFNDPVVRNGLFWAVDRQKVVSTLINPVDKTQTGPLGCGLFAMAGPFWCDTLPL